MLEISTMVPPAHETAEHTQVGTHATLNVDAEALQSELKTKVKGEVRFDAGSRALYATDGSNYRQVPIGVVIPKTIDDVIETVAACRKFGAPLLSRGGGTSLAGQCCNVAVVMDFSKYLHHILWLDPDKRLACVEPGIVLDSLRHTAEKHHLTFGPDPATHTHCTLGGMIGNNSCGIHSVMAGRTADNIESLEILTYDGVRMSVGKTSDQEFDHIISEGGRRADIYSRLRNLRDKYAELIRQRFPRIPRRVSGYNLDELLPENGFNVARSLVGTESTCVVVLNATTQLVHSPPARSLLILGYKDVFEAADHVMEVLAHKPVGLEGLDQEFIDDMKKKHLHPKDIELMPTGNGFLLVEFGGETKEESDARAKELMEQLKKQSNPPSMKLFDDPAHEKMVWEIRESGLGATARVPGQPENWEGWEDSAVHPQDTGKYLRDFKALLDKYGYHGSLYGHFGDGCIHTRLNFDLRTRDGIQKYHRFTSDAADLLAKYHGSFSGEHGDGQSRGELLQKMFGPELLQAFNEFKSIWDPEWKMNPGKVVDPYSNIENLRLGENYNPWDPPTHFKFADDKHSFAFAALRCVGAGVCRRKEGGTMCPSYMVTLEEEHSTRGRARMLFEMLQGDPIKGGWQDEHVKESLDLCLSCKGCKGDCPVHVDMATYKAEFLSHYYEKKSRPREAYAFGLIPYWSRFASFIPELVNTVTQAPLLSELAKFAAGMAPQRRIPTFAPESFRSIFKRVRKKVEGPRVILWADTFNNYFHTETAVAALEVLESAGFDVHVPEQNLCCGRPLYDYGMLPLAKKFLLKIMSSLREDIRAGTPIVVLEPSCAAVFRDELLGLFPEDQDAQRLNSQTFLLSEFLQKKAPHFQPPKLRRKALLHGHCHHKSLMKMGDEEAILKKMGLDFHPLDSGCCGMAGAFGFEKGEHYEVSMKCGERVLLPEVRSASKKTIIITDGFSCKEQIAQSTDRQGLHLAQVIQMAMREGEHAPECEYPEKKYVRAEGSAQRRARNLKMLTRTVAFAAGLGLGWNIARRIRR